MSSRFVKKSLLSVPTFAVKTPCFTLRVRAEDAQTTDENRHLGGSQREQLRLVDEKRLVGHLVLALQIVAETVRGGLEHREALDVGLFLRRIRAAGGERKLHVMAAILRGLLDGGIARENDEVGERHLLGALVELGLDAFERLQHLGEFRGLVRVPVLLRSETDAGAVRATATIGSPVRRG